MATEIVVLDTDERYPDHHIKTLEDDDPSEWMRKWNLDHSYAVPAGMVARWRKVAADYDVMQHEMKTVIYAAWENGKRIDR